MIGAPPSAGGVHVKVIWPVPAPPGVADTVGAAGDPDGVAELVANAPGVPSVDVATTPMSYVVPLTKPGIVVVRPASGPGPANQVVVPVGRKVT